MRHQKEWIMGVVMVLAACTWMHQADAVIGDDESADGAKAAGVVVIPESSSGPVSVEMARERARTMFQVYSSTLDVLHDHYFHANRAVLPARAMEDIFADNEAASGTKARWIAVNVRAMSVDHEPSSDFEKEAARRIAAGEKQLEHVDGPNYQFAGSIPLHESCVQCHMGTLMPAGKKARFAGLVISIPVDVK